MSESNSNLISQLNNVELPENIPQKAKRMRPDGAQVDDYAAYQKWTYRRWAWEFLRRNEEFKKECKELKKFGGDSDEEKLRIAAKFGLKYFKPFNQDYRTNGMPIFVGTTYIFRANLLGEGEEIKNRRIIIRPGEVAVRLDLNAMLNNSWGLRSQLLKVESSIKEIIGSIKVVPETEDKAVERVHREKLLEYLRMLDHRSYGATQLACGALVKGEHSPDPTDSKERTNARNKLMKAIFFANSGYRFLATRVGRPESKKQKSIKLSGS